VVQLIATVGTRDKLGRSTQRLVAQGMYVVIRCTSPVSAFLSAKWVYANVQFTNPVRVF